MRRFFKCFTRRLKFQNRYTLAASKEITKEAANPDLEENMNLSVIIPVSADFRLLKCIQSIDEDVEIVVVFNNNPSKRLIIESRLDPRVKVVTIDEAGCNLASVFNVGISNVSHNQVLLTNSDCVFYPGQVRACEDALKTAPVAKGSILFESNSFATELVAKLRFLFHEVFSERKNLYGPGLAFHRSIVNQIGGYYFDEDIGWGEDGELSKRIYASGLDVVYLEQTMLRHPPESIRHDLRIAYKIGYGEWIQHCKSGTTLPKAIVADVLNLFLDRSHRFRTVLAREGILLFGYLLVWKLTAHLGYYIRAIKEKGGCRDYKE